MLRTAGIGTAAIVLTATARAADEPKPPFSLPALPYAYDALAPHIDEQTMKIHHDLHHGTYVKNLNDIWTKAKLPATSLSEVMKMIAEDKLPKDIVQGVKNNGGGHLNHTLFWEWMAKDAGGAPKGDLGKAIDKDFGSFDKFQTAFADAGAKRFGSGWVWLVKGKEKLEIVSTTNQDNPWMTGQAAILGLDVWEHAYYLKYQNKRADYIKAWWNVVNWKKVEEAFAGK